MEGQNHFEELVNKHYVARTKVITAIRKYFPCKSSEEVCKCNSCKFMESIK